MLHSCTLPHCHRMLPIRSTVCYQTSISCRNTQSPLLTPPLSLILRSQPPSDSIITSSSSHNTQCQLCPSTGSSSSGRRLLAAAAAGKGFGNPSKIASKSSSKGKRRCPCGSGQPYEVCVCVGGGGGCFTHELHQSCTYSVNAMMPWHLKLHPAILPSGGGGWRAAARATASAPAAQDNPMR